MLRIQDALLSAGSVGVIATGLAAMNDDIRRHMMNVVAGNTSEWAIVAAPIGRAATIAMKTMNDYQTDNGALFAFGVAAVVLFGFLFKM